MGGKKLYLDPESTRAKSEILIYPTELNLEKENDFQISYPIGYSGKASEVCITFDASRVRVNPSRLQLAPSKPATVSVIPLDLGSWETNLKIDAQGNILKTSTLSPLNEFENC